MNCRLRCGNWGIGSGQGMRRQIIPLAAGRGIAFSVQAEYPRHANIRSADLCAILGNLLDNALQAGQAGEVFRAVATLSYHGV